MRFNNDGSKDVFFGEEGTVNTTIGTYAAGNSLAVQPNGKILLAGNSSDGIDTVKIALTRYDADGSLDIAFGNGGIITTPIGLYASANGLALQADGKIVTAGFSDNYFAVARYNADFPVGLTSVAKDHQSLFIAPNPSADKIRLSFFTDEKTELQIMNAIGQVVFSEKIIQLGAGTSDKEIDISKFEVGMYEVIIATSSQKYFSNFLKQ